MVRFIAGVVVGVTLGITVSAIASTIVGTGGLVGWTVEHDGEEICSDPSVDKAAKVIECD